MPDDLSVLDNVDTITQNCKQIDDATRHATKQDPQTPTLAHRYYIYYKNKTSANTLIVQQSHHDSILNAQPLEKDMGESYCIALLPGMPVILHSTSI